MKLISSPDALFKYCRYFLNGVIALVSVLVLWYWLDRTSYHAAGIYAPFGPFAPDYTPSDRAYLTGAVLSILSVALIVGALLIMRKILVMFEAGRLFAKQAVRGFRWIGSLAILYAPVSMARDTLTTWVTSFDHPKIEPFIMISFMGEQLFPILLGLLFLVIAEVFTAARDNRHELDAFI